MLGFVAAPFIRREIKSHLKKGADKFNENHRIFTKLVDIESVKAFPTLQKALVELKMKEFELYDHVSSDKFIEPIVSVLSKHISDLKSADALKRPSILNIKQFALHIIDMTNYTTLSELIVKAQHIDTLEQTEQQAVFTALTDGKLLANIQQENEALNLETIKHNFEQLAAGLQDDFKLKDAEFEKLKNIYHGIIDKHAPIFDNLRKELLKDLPHFLELEKERMLKACPQLASVGDVEEKAKTFTVQYDDQASKPKEEKAASNVVELDQKKTKDTEVKQAQTEFKKKAKK